MAAAPALSLVKLGQIAVPVRDTDRATAFYRDVLGLKHLFSAPPKLAFFDGGGVRLMLSPPEGAGSDSRGSVLYFRVPDLHAAHTALEERGVTIVAPPHLIAPMADHDLWMLFFKDSEDNLLALMSEVPRT